MSRPEAELAYEQLAFIGAGTTALVEAARRLGSQQAGFWSRNPNALQTRIVAALSVPTGIVKQELTGQNFSVTCLANRYVAATHAKLTSECLRGWNIDPEQFFSRLPDVQPSTSAQCVDAHSVVDKSGFTFADAAAYLLGVSRDTPHSELQLLLKEQGHTLTLPVLEALVAIHTLGKDAGFSQTGDTFAFAENRQGGVSVLQVKIGRSAWTMHLEQFCTLIRFQNAPFLIGRSGLK